ncbi:MAG: hypothetical protein Kow0031_34250 [Anaerolineae bacterium]
MTTDDNFSPRWQWFHDQYGHVTNGAGVQLTPEAAQQLIDQAIRKLGLDPADVTGPGGWRELGFGSALCRVNIIEWQPGIHALVIWSPLVWAPQQPQQRAKLFETLLLLNADFTGQSRLALTDDDLVILTHLRPIAGLQLEEVLDALKGVLRVADRLDEPLQMLGLDLPHVMLDNATMAGVVALFRLCDPTAQAVFRRLLEGWSLLDGKITVGSGSIHLKTPGKPVRTLAALIGYAAAGPLVTVGGDWLEKSGLPAAQIDAFFEQLPRPAGFKQNGLSAHLPANGSFTPAMVDDLLNTLIKLAELLKYAQPVKTVLPDLYARWGLRLKVGGATQSGIDALLEACPEQTRAVYIRLIQGWFDAGQKLYTKDTDRVALRMTANGSTFALATLFGPQKKRPPRIELHYPTTYYLGDHPAGQVYETAVAALPGFEPHNSGARLAMGDQFKLPESEQLLTIITTLARQV